MISTLHKLNELYTVAIPVQGIYKDYIGSASINDTYTVKVMLKTGSLNHTNKGKTTTYNFTQGYIMLKPLIDQFQNENPDSYECRDIGQWKKSNQKIFQNLKINPTIAIKGSLDVQGTYFHPSIVSSVLAWVSEDLKKMIFDTFENAGQQSWKISQLMLQIKQKDQQIQDIETNKQREQLLYQSKLKTQSIQINNIAIQMYGNLENPLFECQQILIPLLGYKVSNQCWFYQQNKDNKKYITILIQDGVQKKYFTEIGLYRCLFTSQKPIAVEFQEQVALLLKDIRLGNIKLQVQKECQTTELIRTQQCDLLKYITENSELEDQVESLQEENDSLNTKLQGCKKTCSLYIQKVLDEHGQIEHQYGGQSAKPIQRNKQHRSRSSNPGLRHAISIGKQVEFVIVDTFEYYTEAERKQRERDLILNIPIQQRLNRQIPRV